MERLKKYGKSNPVYVKWRHFSPKLTGTTVLNVFNEYTSFIKK